MKTLRCKSYVVGLAIGACALLFINAIVSNPTQAETQRSLVLMKQEAEALLANGGKIIAVDNIAKYGRARLGFVIAAEGWSATLKQKYVITLQSRNWIKVPGDEIQFCKDGMIVKLRENPGMFQNQSVSTLDFIFDGGTKRECANATAS